MTGVQTCALPISAVSLSAFFNNGALPCGCHEVGSDSDTCQAFGGQCSCGPHVIGRDCSQCATGYWGFPNCRREHTSGANQITAWFSVPWFMKLTAFVCVYTCVCVCAGMLSAEDYEEMRSSRAGRGRVQGRRKSQ